MKSSSKAQILARIRAANPGFAESSAGSETTSAAEDWLQLPREYRRSGGLDSAARIALFEERLREYDARVFRVSAGDLPGRIENILLESGKRRMLAPQGIPEDWRSGRLSWVLDSRTLDSSAEGLSNAELSSVDGVLTSAAVAIASTGTIVLTHDAQQGRRALTLLPDYHLCVVSADRVVETVPEAFDRLRDAANRPLTRPITMISGPSATADIEMTRIKGVHGPRFLDVILATA